MVPGCKMSSRSDPRRRFLAVPNDEKRRAAWMRAVGRNPKEVSKDARLQICADHFNLEEDCINWIRQKYYGGKIRLKPDVVPHIFKKQSGTSGTEKSSEAEKPSEKSSDTSLISNSSKRATSRPDSSYWVIPKPLSKSDDVESIREIVVSEEDGCTESKTDTIGERLPWLFPPKKVIQWQRVETPNKNSVGNPKHLINRKLKRVVVQPIKCFGNYLPDFLFKSIANSTNWHAIKNSADFRPTGADELKILFGLHIYMSTVGLNRIEELRNVYPDSGSMTLRRFLELRRNLRIVAHCDPADRFHQIRPILDWILARCRSIMPEENLYVGEQLIPCRHNINVEQDSANPKLFVLCGKSGLVYDFVINQGDKTDLNVENVKKIGKGPAVVVKLMQNIPQNEHHRLFFNEYFTSYDLLEACSQRGILAVGVTELTIFANPPFLSDEVMKSEGKTCDVLSSQDGEVVLVKWQESKTVIFASNFVECGLKDIVNKYDKVEKTVVKVDKPRSATLYNEAISGIEKLDYLLNLYRICVPSEDSTLSLVMFCVDFALVNAWLKYKADVGFRSRKSDVLDFAQFRVNVAKTLVCEPICLKIGSVDECPLKRKFNKNHHLPSPAELGQCASVECDLLSAFQCVKCGVHLCVTNGKRCFSDFHNINCVHWMLGD